ncbi:hypothetical protein [Candidatus Poriferisodalis sp.]|uniref:hypothetical protein n=1 Tax=Candidatus Poriferisodalis sp. TaxID=3101277 RepID=UPI003B02386D
MTDVEGRLGLAGCRHCDDTDPQWYVAALAAANFETGGNGVTPPHRVTRPRPAPSPAPKPVANHKKHIADLARRLVEAAGPVPARVREGWRCGLIRSAQPSALAWLDAAALQRLKANVPEGSAGALVAPLGAGVACQLLYLDHAHKKFGSPDKRTYGPAAGRGFGVGAGDTLRVCEGVADALALSTQGGTVAAAVGSGGMGRLALAALHAGPARWRRITLVPDGDDQAAIQKARATLAKLHAMSLTLGATCEFAIDAGWAPDPAAVWEGLR